MSEHHKCTFIGATAECKTCSVTICEGCAFAFDSKLCEECEFKLFLLNDPNAHIIGSIDNDTRFKYYPPTYLIAWYAKDLKELEKIKEELQKANEKILELELRPPEVGGRLFLEGQARAIANGMRP